MLGSQSSENPRREAGRSRSVFLKLTTHACEIKKTWLRTDVKTALLETALIGFPLSGDRKHMEAASRSEHEWFRERKTDISGGTSS